jgi:putative membrane protein
MFYAAHMGLLLQWLLNALGLLLLTYVLPGFEVESFGTALWAALVVGILNVTLGFLLHLVLWPLGWLLPNLIYVVVEAVMLYVAAMLVRGFRIRGYLTAFFAACLLTLIHIAFGLL